MRKLIALWERVCVVADIAERMELLISDGELLNAGKIQKNLEDDEDFKTPLQQKLDEFGQQLSKVSLTALIWAVAVCARLMMSDIGWWSIALCPINTVTVLGPVSTWIGDCLWSGKPS